MEIKDCKGGQLIYKAHTFAAKIYIETVEVLFCGINCIFGVAIRGDDKSMYAIGHEYAFDPVLWQPTKKEALKKLKREIEIENISLNDKRKLNQLKLSNIEKMLKEIET